MTMNKKICEFCNYHQATTTVPAAFPARKVAVCSKCADHDYQTWQDGEWELLQEEAADRVFKRAS